MPCNLIITCKSKQCVCVCVFINKYTHNDERLNGVCVGVCNYLPHTLSSLLDYQCFPEARLCNISFLRFDPQRGDCQSDAESLSVGA